MCDFEKGDKVRVLASMDRDGQEGIIEYTFDDYGTPSVCVKFEDGGWQELTERSVEYIGPDKYEYSVQFFYVEAEEWDDVTRSDWMTKPHAERWLKAHEATNRRLMEQGKAIETRGRLVRRKKAGRAEPVDE